jgi:tRNA dimethylallyltransferase
MTTPIVCLMGPTASGKTALALELLQHFPFEIISVDSAMIYCGMDIGTAKPTAAELAQAPHRLIDICDPGESYSVARFLQDVKHEIIQVQQNGNIPLLVGGTMMYFNALRAGLSPLPQADEQVRRQIETDAAQFGWPALHTRLAVIDPPAHQRIGPNDKQRIARALEVYAITGRPLSEQWHKVQDAYQGKLLALAVAPQSRALLHERIAKRWYQLIDQGMIGEVKALKARNDLSLQLPSIRSVGYRQVWQYLDGVYDLDTLHHKAIVATRRLAKRQMTWLRSWPDLSWFDSDDAQLLSYVAQWLNKTLR